MAPDASAGRAPLRIVPLTGETWDALAALFREGGDPRWCWCQHWRLRAKDFAALRVPQLRERLHDQAEAASGPGAAAEPPGLVALEREADGAERAVGWVSLGPRASFERIERSKVIPRIDGRPVWSIVCFAVSASARDRGIGSALLEAAVAFARDRGATAVEAYPVVVEAGEPVTAEAAFTGTLPMFERAGFAVVADRASDPSSRHRRVVVRRDLGAAVSRGRGPAAGARDSRR
jgi:GNAT superfamily N-acetyltransferase